MPKEYQRPTLNISYTYDEADVLSTRESAFEDWKTKSGEYVRLHQFLKAIQDQDKSKLARTDGYRDIFSNIQSFLTKAEYITRRYKKWYLDSEGDALLKGPPKKTIEWEMYCQNIVGKVVGLSNLQGNGHNYCIVRRDKTFFGGENKEEYSYGVFLYLLGLVESYDLYTYERNKTKKYEFKLTECGKRVYKGLCDLSSMHTAKEAKVPSRHANHCWMPIIVVIVVLVIFGYVFITRNDYAKEKIVISIEKFFQVSLEREKTPKEVIESTEDRSR